MTNSQPVQHRTQIIQTDDHYPLAITRYSCEQPRAVVVIAPAVAAPQSFYQAFAEYLTEQGMECITFDYRGTGASLSAQSPFRIQLAHWGQKDLEAVLGFALATHDSRTLPVHLVGHSIGGQMVGLAPSAAKLGRIVHVAVSAPYWRRWPLKTGLKMLLLGKVLIPALSAFRDQFPSATVGLGQMAVPTSATRQWARWMSRQEYFFDPRFKLDLSGFKALKQPILALGFDDDELAPEVNIASLLNHFPNALVERWQINARDPGQGPIRHAGFFKPRFKESLWQGVAQWLLREA